MHVKEFSILPKKYFGWRTRFLVTFSIIAVLIITLCMLFLLAREELGILLIGLLVLLILFFLPLAAFSMDAAYGPK
jgi:ABC-type multidrug transport system permease subunit